MKKSERKKHDLMWAAAVKHRDGQCVWCQDEGKFVDVALHAHHIFGKGTDILRFDLTNGIALCCKHHLFTAHGSSTNHAKYEQWIRRYFGQSFMDGLERKASMTAKSNPAMLEDTLRLLKFHYEAMKYE